MAVVSLFTNQALPTAGVAGTVVIVQALKRRGVPMSAALSAMLVDLVGYYAGFGVAVGLSLTVFAVHHELSAIVVGMAAAISLTAIVICGGILWLSAPGHRVPAILARVGPLRRAVATLAVADPALLRSPTLLLLAGLLRFGNFVLDAVTLWACFRAVGEAPPVTYVGAAYVLGTIARTLGVVPGGLGTFEGGTLAGLALLGIAVEPSLAGVLLFRLLSFWLPMVPGLVLSRRFSKSRG